MLSRIDDAKRVAGVINALLRDPGTSFWLRNAASALLERDPVDAANDAAALANLMRLRLANFHADME